MFDVCPFRHANHRIGTTLVRYRWVGVQSLYCSSELVSRGNQKTTLTVELQQRFATRISIVTSSGRQHSYQRLRKQIGLKSQQNYILSFRNDRPV